MLLVHERTSTAQMVVGHTGHKTQEKSLGGGDPHLGSLREATGRAGLKKGIYQISSRELIVRRLRGQIAERDDDDLVIRHRGK